MRIPKEPRELGDYYEPEGFDWIFFLTITGVIVLVIIAYVKALN